MEWNGSADGKESVPRRGKNYSGVEGGEGGSRTDLEPELCTCSLSVEGKEQEWKTKVILLCFSLGEHKLLATRRINYWHNL